MGSKNLSPQRLLDPTLWMKIQVLDPTYTKKPKYTHTHTHRRGDTGSTQHKEKHWGMARAMTYMLAICYKRSSSLYLNKNIEEEDLGNGGVTAFLKGAWIISGFGFSWRWLVIASDKNIPAGLQCILLGLRKRSPWEAFLRNLFLFCKFTWFWFWCYSKMGIVLLFI